MHTSYIVQIKQSCLLIFNRTIYTVTKVHIIFPNLYWNESDQLRHVLYGSLFKKMRQYGKLCSTLLISQWSMIVFIICRHFTFYFLHWTLKQLCLWWLEHAVMSLLFVASFKSLLTYCHISQNWIVSVRRAEGLQCFTSDLKQLSDAQN